jgi:hypothetical protein
MSRDDRATSGHGLSRCDLLKTTAGAAVALVAGSPVKVHIPREALRVLPAGGTAVIERGELEDA